MLSIFNVKSAKEIKYVDSGELFQKVSNREREFVEGVNGSIPGPSIFFQDQEDMFIKKDGNMYVEHVTVEEFKKKLRDLYLSPSQYSKIQDNIRMIILNTNYFYCAVKMHKMCGKQNKMCGKKCAVKIKIMCGNLTQNVR